MAESRQCKNSSLTADGVAGCFSQWLPFPSTTLICQVTHTKSCDFPRISFFTPWHLLKHHKTVSAASVMVWGLGCMQKAKAEQAASRMTEQKRPTVTFRINKETKNSKKEMIYGGLRQKNMGGNRKRLSDSHGGLRTKTPDAFPSHASLALGRKRKSLTGCFLILLFFMFFFSLAELGSGLAFVSYQAAEEGKKEKSSRVTQTYSWGGGS